MVEQYGLAVDRVFRHFQGGFKDGNMVIGRVGKVIIDIRGIVLYDADAQ